MADVSEGILNAYSHLTWQRGDLPWGAPTHQIWWPFDPMVFQHHERQTKNISTTRVALEALFKKEVLFLANIEHCPKFLEYALEWWLFNHVVLLDYMAN